MKVHISRSELKGTAAAPPSKSYTIRGLICAALARGRSDIINPLLADDTEAASRVLVQMGAAIGRGWGSWTVQGGSLHQPEGDLFCGDSAATLRFMTAVCSAIPGDFRLTTGPSLSRRPIQPLINALRLIGVECSLEGGAVLVRGGNFKGGTVSLPGDISSQFVSALLLAAPLAKTGLTINLTTPPVSEPYIDMTLDCMALFGIKSSRIDDGFQVARKAYHPTRYPVEGDWSSASYFLALGALGGDITVENLNPQTRQADRALLDMLREMGAQVETGQNSAHVTRSPLKGVQADLDHCIDLLPTMLAVAAMARGASEFTGIARARIKESDRVSAMVQGLNRMGIMVREMTDSLVIYGEPRGAVIDSYNDHRIAMAFSILGCLTGKTTITGAECVAKTFPQFWDILKSIGGKVTIEQNGE